MYIIFKVYIYKIYKEINKEFNIFLVILYYIKNIGSGK